jgi:cysteine synthase A
MDEGAIKVGAVREGLAGAIGHTPLLRLRRLSEETGCAILGKAEFLNPSGSVKDRAALALIEDAERDGRLHAGGTVVEGTAGNTGIALAQLCQARGYRCLIVIPETQSPEKMTYLAALGAQVRPVPARPYRDPDNYIKVAARLAAEMDNAVWANQFDNTANRAAHARTTGAEIWAQTGGRVDAFVAAVGTGGTLAGVSDYLKARNPRVRIVLADPTGSGLYHYIKTGEPKMEGPASLTEGIGNSRVTENLRGAAIDDALVVDDRACVHMVYQLLREEGLFVGSSTGINVAAAGRVARELGPGHTIVTVLCDGGGRYLSRLFNREWLRQRGLADAISQLS